MVWRFAKIKEVPLAPKFPIKGRVMSRTPLPPCPRKSAPLWCIFFALPALNDPQPAELKFTENAVQNKGM